MPRWICDTSRKTNSKRNLMKPILRDTRRLAVGVALACATILFPTATLVAAASRAPTTVTSCDASNIHVWAAAEGYGTAGTTYYELEFSNVGRRTCTLHGYPDVWAIDLDGLQIGRPASHQGVPGAVRLQPGATSHAVVGVEDAGAVCGRSAVTAEGLRVVPPGQTLPKPAGEADTVEHFSLQVCAHQSSMNVRPVHSGTGIPGYTFS